MAESKELVAGPLPDAALAQAFSPDDVYIALMGVTGSGKSTFISKCCDSAASGVGHGLQSMTQDVAVHSFPLHSRKIHLIDTPGFDDTYRSDSDVLKELAYWLSCSYDRGLKLTGIIYLHPITHNRMFGSAFKNLRTFKKLCGAQSMSSIILATTMWSDVPLETGARHEKDLVSTPQFWGDMVREGSTVLRHSGDHQSAVNIISHLLGKPPTVLEIQSEMVDQHKQLDDTEAGREVEVELLRQRQYFERQLKDTEESIREALEQQNKQQVAELLREQEEFHKKLQSIQQGREELKISLETLIEQKEKAHREAMASLHDRFEETKTGYERQIKMLEKAQKLAQQEEHQNSKQRAAIDAELKAAREKAKQSNLEKSKMMAEWMDKLQEERRKAEQEKRAATDEVRRNEAQRREAELRKQEEALKANYENAILQQQMAAALQQQQQQQQAQQQQQQQQQQAQYSPSPPPYSPQMAHPYPSYPVYQQPQTVYYTKESSSSSLEGLSSSMATLAGNALAMAAVTTSCTIM